MADAELLGQLKVVREENLRFTEEDWAQLHALANGYEGKPVGDLVYGVKDWFGSRLAGERFVVHGRDGRVREQHTWGKRDPSSFEDADVAARDEDREKPRIGD